MFVKKLLRWVGLAAIIIIALIAVLNIIVVQTAKPYIFTKYETDVWADENGGATAILVLGASVSAYGPSPILASRLDEGLVLYSLDVSDLLLLSGDNGTVDYNEVQAMKNYVIANGAALGLTEENIYLDYAGFSTYDSIYRAKHIFGADKIVIVTQRYHLYRALYIADRLGLDAVGVVAPDVEHQAKQNDYREVPARVKDFFITAIGYEPKIMGDPVPLDYPSSQATPRAAERP
jgi:vancomycin permeability regulator SanA